MSGNVVSIVMNM